MKVFKKVTSLFLAALLTLSALAVVPFTAAAAENPTPTNGWTTETDGKYHIRSINDLYAMLKMSMDNTTANDFTGKEVLLETDIDMEGYTWVHSGYLRFAGTFDGQGHAIKNYTASVTAAYGFFDYLTGSAVVKNVRFEDVDFEIGTKAANSAVLARAVNSSPTIDNVYVGGDVHSKIAGGSFGGFVAQLAGGTLTIRNSVSDITYTCDSTQNGETTTYTNSAVGGFVGLPNMVSTTLNMSDCVFIGDIRYGAAGSAGLVSLFSQSGGNSSTETTSTFTRCLVLGRVAETTSASPSHIYVQANTGAVDYNIEMTDCFLANPNEYAVLAASTDTAHKLTATFTNGNKTISQPGDGETKLAQGQTALKTFFVENGAMGDAEKAHTTVDINDYTTLKNNGWVVTSGSVEYASGKTISKMMPESVADMITNPATVSYWQVKAGTKENTNDFRFVAKINFADLAAYDEVGYEVTVKVQGGDTLINKQQITTDKVYTSIKAGDDVKLATDLDANYLIALSINGFKNADTTYEVTITPIVKCGTSVIHDADHTVTGTITGNVFTQD